MGQNDFNLGLAALLGGESYWGSDCFVLAPEKMCVVAGMPGKRCNKYVPELPYAVRLWYVYPQSI